MNEKLIKALKLALKTKGLSEELYEFVPITEEGEIDAAVDKLLGIMPKPLTLAETLELPEYKKEVDRRITKSIDTFKSTHKIKIDEPAKVEVDDDEKIPSYIKTLLESNKKLVEEVEAMKTGKTIETKQSEALTLLKGSKVIPANVQEKWLKRFDLSSETSLEDQFKELEGEFTEIQQTFANDQQYASNPGLGNPDEKPSDAQVDAIVGSVV